MGIWVAGMGVSEAISRQGGREKATTWQNGGYPGHKKFKVRIHEQRGGIRRKHAKEKNERDR